MFQKKYTSYTYIFRGTGEDFHAYIPETSRKNAAARVQEKISREYTRGRPEKHRRSGTGEDFPRIYPWSSGKMPPRGYRERFPRGYTRGRPGKHRRAGTGKDFPRIYPRPAGKMPPRGYRERNRANIPVAGRKNTAARVQEKISRGYTRGLPENTAARVQEKISREYTRGQPEKHRRAGTGKDFPRIYPRPAGKTPPRGYRERFPADIPENMRRLAPRELY